MNKKGNYSVPEIVAWIFGIILILLFVFWMNNQNLNTRYKNLQEDYVELNQSHAQVTQDYINLKQECDAIKRDTKEVLTEYVATEILWEISGASKYRKLVDAIGILAKTN